MLHENIKALRTSKGLSQEELAVHLHIVRQTISKWENGLSVPDSDMLIALGEVLETPVGVLLGETVTPQPDTEMQVIAQKLEVINIQLARRRRTVRTLLRAAALAAGLIIILITVVRIALPSPYLTWDFTDPETAVIGTSFHAFEWLFIRIAPFVLAAVILVLFLMGRRVK